MGDLALTADGTRLYATLRGSNQVAEIDTGSLTVIRRIPLNAYPCPSHLALLGTRLYVGYGCGGDWKAGVVGFDVSAAEPEFATLSLELDAAPLVAAAGQKLVVGETVISPSDIFVYDLTDTGPTMRGIINGNTHRLSNLQDISITADGSTVFSAFGAPYRFDAWDTTGLTLVRSYGEGS
ncbi:YncE family protein [Nonomuraea sp. NPDC003560]|uniref:YncE family protein n=1 Tax=Nonomuraea sp. NPDC003560 TaxID=3364341 RepID=UPI00367A7408